MKLKQTALLLSGMVALSALAQPQLISPNQPMNAEPVPPDKEKLSYAIGMSVGTSIKRQGIDVNVDTIAQAMRDMVAGNPTRLTEKEMSELLNRDLRAYLQAKQRAESQKLEAKGPQSKKEGEEFLAKNASAQGVKTLPDGLQYKVLKEGTGETPTTNDTAEVSYRGTLIDGTEFDKNDDATMSLRQVIKGWTEALSMMKVGSKWTIFVPADLAYGTQARPPKIAPNSVLVFDLELLGVKRMPPRPQFPPPAPPAATIQSPAAPGSTNASVVSGQIIRVPSAEELKKGAKIEVIDPSQTNVVSQTNAPSPK